MEKSGRGKGGQVTTGHVGHRCPAPPPPKPPVGGGWGEGRGGAGVPCAPSMRERRRSRSGRGRSWVIGFFFSENPVRQSDAFGTNLSPRGGAPADPMRWRAGCKVGEKLQLFGMVRKSKNAITLGTLAPKVRNCGGQSLCDGQNSFARSGLIRTQGGGCRRPCPPPVGARVGVLRCSDLRHATPWGPRDTHRWLWSPWSEPAVDGRRSKGIIRRETRVTRTTTDTTTNTASRTTTPPPRHRLPSPLTPHRGGGSRRRCRP